MYVDVHKWLAGCNQRQTSRKSTDGSASEVIKLTATTQRKGAEGEGRGVHLQSDGGRESN